MVGRFVLGPVLGSAGFLLADSRLLAEGDRAIRRAWLLHALGLAVVFPVVALAFGMPICSTCSPSGSGSR